MSSDWKDRVYKLEKQLSSSKLKEFKLIETQSQLIYKNFLKLMTLKSNSLIRNKAIRSDKNSYKTKRIGTAKPFKPLDKQPELKTANETTEWLAQDTEAIAQLDVNLEDDDCVTPSLIDIVLKAIDLHKRNKEDATHLIGIRNLDEEGRAEQRTEQRAKQRKEQSLESSVCSENTDTSRNISVERSELSSFEFENQDMLQKKETVIALKDMSPQLIDRKLEIPRGSRKKYNKLSPQAGDCMLNQRTSRRSARNTSRKCNHSPDMQTYRLETQRRLIRTYSENSVVIHYNKKDDEIKERGQKCLRIIKEQLDILENLFN